MIGATRNIASFAASRLAGHPITLRYSDKTLNDDGSYSLTESDVPEMSYVVDLSNDDIKRLQQGGITVNEGVSITLNKELTQIPDFILYGLDTYKVLKYVISENVSILTCGRIALGSALLTPAPVQMVPDPTKWFDTELTIPYSIYGSFVLDDTARERVLFYNPNLKRFDSISYTNLKNRINSYDYLGTTTNKFEYASSQTYVKGEFFYIFAPRVDGVYTRKIYKAPLSDPINITYTGFELPDVGLTYLHTSYVGELSDGRLLLIPRLVNVATRHFFTTDLSGDLLTWDAHNTGFPSNIVYIKGHAESEGKLYLYNYDSASNNVLEFDLNDFTQWVNYLAARPFLSEAQSIYKEEDNFYLIGLPTASSGKTGIEKNSYTNMISGWETRGEWQNIITNSMVHPPAKLINGELFQFDYQKIYVAGEKEA